MTCSYTASQGTECQYDNHVDDFKLNFCNVYLCCPMESYHCDECDYYHNRHVMCYSDVPDCPQCKHCQGFFLMNTHDCVMSKHRINADDALNYCSPAKVRQEFDIRQIEKIKNLMKTADYDVAVVQHDRLNGFPEPCLPEARLSSYSLFPYYGAFVIHMLQELKDPTRWDWKNIKFDHIYGKNWVLYGEDLYEVIPTNEEICTEEWFLERKHLLESFWESGAQQFLKEFMECKDLYVRDHEVWGKYDDRVEYFNVICDEKTYVCRLSECPSFNEQATCWSDGLCFRSLTVRLNDKKIFDAWKNLQELEEARAKEVDECTEQLDEGLGANEAHPNETDAKPKENEKVEVTTQPADDLSSPSETKSSNQAIDTPEEIIGENCGRKTIRVSTPSGLKDAIIISDCLDIPKQDFTLNVPLPEIGMVWTTVTPEDGTTGKNYPIAFSDRTKYLMNLFKYYTSGAVYKIVAKIPLFQSQKFWVSFLPNGVTTGDVFRFAGFEWNPSEMNEIYVVVPWSSSEYMLPIDQTLSSINITPITSLVSAEGLATPIEIAVYSAPHNMNLYIPEIIVPVTPPGTPKVRTLEVTDATQLPVGTQLFPMPVTVGKTASLTYDSDVASVSTAGVITKFTLTQPTALSEFTPVNCKVAVISTDTEGPMADLDQTGNIKVYKASTTSTNPQFQSGDAIVLYNDEDPAAFTSMASHGLTANTIMEIDSGSISVNNVVVEGTVKTEGVTGPLYVGKIPRSELDLLEEEYTEQIFEYNYQPPSEAAEHDHGSAQDHTRRLDRHYQNQEQLVINKTDDVTIIPLYTNVSDDYAFYDAKRHLFFGGFPVVKLVFNSIPTTNALLRFTLVDSRTAVSLDEALQLPGIEVDPKVGAYSILPWWCYTYPLRDFNQLVGDTTNNWTLQCHVLSGSFGTGAPIRYGYLYNASHLQYAHLRGVDTLGTAVEEEYTEQMLDSAPEAKSNQQGDVATRPEEGVSSDSERRWNYVSSFKVPQDVALVEIPINRAIMGSWFHIHNSRYNRWRGNLKLKIMVNNSSLVNGNIHVTQANTSVTGTVKASELLEKISYSSGGAPGKPFLIDVEWRNLKPWLNPTDSLGSLFIAIPQRTVNNFSTTDSFQFTLYADVSDIELTMPVGPTGFSTWPGITVTTYKAAEAAVETLGLGTSVCH